MGARRRRGAGRARREARGCRGAGLSRGRRWTAALVIAAAAAGATALSAQDVFLHPRGFFIGPDATITVPVFDGTFARSAGAVPSERLLDLTLWGPGGRTRLDRDAWTTRGARSAVQVRVGGPGTYVVGAALAPQTRARLSQTDAVKTILAVTDANGRIVARPGVASAATAPLGHAAEVVPLADPYAVGIRGTLPVRALVDGTPIAGAVVLAGGTVGTSTEPIPVQRLTTDADGRAAVRLTHDGHWFVTVVHTRAAPRGSAFDRVSSRASLTFGVIP